MHIDTINRPTILSLWFILTVKEFARKNGSLENVSKSKPLDRKPVVVSGKQGKIRIEKMDVANIDLQVLTPNPLTYFHYSKKDLSNHI